MLLHTSSPDVSVPNPILFLLLGPQQLNMPLITKHGLLGAFTVYYLFVLHKLYGHAYCQNISTFCFVLFCFIGLSLNGAVLNQVIFNLYKSQLICKPNLVGL